MEIQASRSLSLVFGNERQTPIGDEEQTEKRHRNRNPRMMQREQGKDTVLHLINFHSIYQVTYNITVYRPSIALHTIEQGEVSGLESATNLS